MHPESSTNTRLQAEGSSLWIEALKRHEILQQSLEGAKAKSHWSLNVSRDFLSQLSPVSSVGLQGLRQKFRLKQPLALRNRGTQMGSLSARLKAFSLLLLIRKHISQTCSEDKGGTIQNQPQQLLMHLT